MRMKMKLCKSNIDIAEFSLAFGLTDLFVEDSIILNKDSLPINIENDDPDYNMYITSCDPPDYDTYLTSWLRQRGCFITKDDTDEDIMDFYSCVYRYTLGRMDPYIMGKAILQYMISPDDDYYITPLKPDLIYFGYIDERFSRMFKFVPYEFRK